MFESASQFEQVLLLAAAGALAGGVAACFAAARRLMRAGLLLSLCCDIALGACWAALFCAAVARAARGEARVFHIISFVAGGVVAVRAVIPISPKALRIIAAARRRATKSRLIARIFK